MIAIRMSLDQKRWKRTAARYEALLRSPSREAMKGAVGARDMMKMYWDSGGDRTWPALSPRTLELRRLREGYYKERQGSGTRPLIWTRGFRRSVSEKKAHGHIEEVTGPKTLEFGTDYWIIRKGGRRVPLAKIHNATRPVMPTPAAGFDRMFLGTFFLDALHKGFRRIRGGGAGP